MVNLLSNNRKKRCNAEQMSDICAIICTSVFEFGLDKHDNIVVLSVMFVLLLLTRLHQCFIGVDRNWKLPFDRRCRDGEAPADTSALPLSRRWWLSG